MRKFKYPLLVLLVLSVVAAEGYGQYVRVQGAVEMNDGKLHPGVAYACMDLKNRMQNSGKTESAWNVIVGQEQETTTEEWPIREFETVDQSYFDDALFIGDSRMVGMSEYSGLDNATYYAEVGLTIYSLFDEPIAPLADGSIGTLEQALREKQFGKIYLMVGINELGTGTREKFLETYSAAVEHIKELQPNAIIFIQGILYVTEERSAEDEYINNLNIQLRNMDISKLADQRRTFYIDVNTVYSDGKGNLSTEYTFDSAHLKAACYDQWVTFLMEHGIVTTPPES